MSFLHILVLMLPIIIPVVAGYIFVKLKIFTRETGDQLLKYILYATFPALILVNLSSDSVLTLLQQNFSLATITAIISMYILTFFLYIFFFKGNKKNAAVASLTTSFVSAGIVGLPVMANIIGLQDTVVPVIVNTVISLLTVVPLTIFIIKFQDHRKNISFVSILTSTLFALIKNPLVVSALLGLLLISFHIPIPFWLKESLHKIGDATFATALFAVGIGIDIKLLQKNFTEIFVISFLRMVIFTALGIFFALYFHLSPALAVAFVIIFSLPGAKSIPPIAQEYHTYTASTIQIITLSTLMTIFTLPIVLLICNSLWPGVIH